MIRVSVLYPNTGKFDMEYYLTHHIALVHRLLDAMGLVRAEVDQGIGSVPPNAPAPYIAIGHLVFDSLENMQKALQKHDPALAADVPNFTDIRPQFQISKMVA
jgi:uncharacterized protein (TIGR02118 family)